MQAPRVVVVGLDFSPLSELALHRAMRATEAAPYATIHAVCVGRKEGGEVHLPDGSHLSEWAAMDSVRFRLAQMVKHWPHVGPANLRVVGHVRAGDPPKALLDMGFKTNAEKIFVGAHSQAQSGVFGIGSVARRVLSDSPVEVHVEAPMTSDLAPAPTFDPMRWAFVFGTGTRKARDDLGMHELLESGDY